jgi:hypothetical protein
MASEKDLGRGLMNWSDADQGDNCMSDMPRRVSNPQTGCGTKLQTGSYIRRPSLAHWLHPLCT